MPEIISNRVTAGGLRCQLVETATQTPKRHLVILCHGFGAPGDDLVGLAHWLLEELDGAADEFRFAFPEAPIDMGPMGLPGGRAWWPINMAMLAEISQTQDFDQLAALEPEGLKPACDKLHAAVRELQAISAIDDGHTVVGGFSQGAMVTTDLVLRHGLQPGLLALFSGTLICRERWAGQAAEHPGCPVVQSHGRFDPVLPFPLAEQLASMLQTNGFSVRFTAFRGQHEIPHDALVPLVQGLIRLAAEE